MLIMLSAFIKTRISIFQNRHKVLIILYLALFALGLTLSAIYTRSEIIIWINQWHALVFDYLMRGISYLGTGPVYFIIIALVWFKNRAYAYGGLWAFLLSSAITQGLKHLLFSDVWRPLAVIPNEQLYIPFIDNNAFRYSFPSGHATIIFTLLAFVSYYFKASLAWLCFVFAILVVYSRLYLLQHFLIDITIGSLIGFGSGLISIIIWEYYRKQ